MELFFAILVFVFGLAFGSFLNVCIYRMPRDKSVVSPGSACPNCAHSIRWFDNIPVLSWLILAGKCRDCGTKITPRYALVELLTAVLFLGCFLQFGPLGPIAAAKYCVFCFLILGLIFTDAETKLLPDLLTLPGVVLGLAFSFFVPVNDLISKFFPELWDLNANGWRLRSFSDALLGAIIGAGFIYGSGFAYKLARGVEGMGFGDVKLMAMIGAFLGLRLTVFTIFAASIAGAVFGLASIPVVWAKRTRRRMSRGHEPREVASKRAWQSAKNVYRYYAMPFGVFLGSMALVAVFFGKELLHWYLGPYL